MIGYKGESYMWTQVLFVVSKDIFASISGRRHIVFLVEFEGYKHWITAYYWDRNVSVLINDKTGGT